MFCITAPPKRAHASLAALRADTPPPLLDAVAELPYPTLQSTFDPLAAIGSYNQIAGQSYAALPSAAAEQFIRFGESAPTWLSFTHIYPLDGAAARGPDGAWPWRGAGFAQMILGAGDAPGHDDELREWATGFSAALAPYAQSGAYSNFLMDEGSDRARASYGDSHPRLAAIKTRYDLDNVFRHNQNIEPAA